METMTKAEHKSYMLAYAAGKTDAVADNPYGIAGYTTGLERQGYCDGYSAGRECEAVKSHGAVIVKAGQAVKMRLPWSEVCIYIGVAEKVMPVELVAEAGQVCAQIRQMDGRPYSAPVTIGEAGFWQIDAETFYFYPD